MTNNIKLKQDMRIDEDKNTEVILGNLVEERDQEECGNAMRTFIKENDDCGSMDKVAFKSDKVIKDDDLNIATVMPSVSGKCEKMKNGLCRIHECGMKKFTVSTRK